MKTYIRIILTLVAILTLNGWPVDAGNFLLRARIPFEFTIGDKTLPPGTYHLSRVDGSEAVFMVRGATDAVYFISHGAENQAYGDEAKLFFNRYGDRYFLREVWFAGDHGHPLQESRTERQFTSARADQRPAERVLVKGETAR